jgi:hypothetical protein
VDPKSVLAAPVEKATGLIGTSSSKSEGNAGEFGPTARDLLGVPVKDFAISDPFGAPIIFLKN